MAKTIKFNLICDNKPIRTIEDLRENFSIEDVLEYYNNGLLQRWLLVRGYDEYLREVKNINSKKNMEIIKKLIKIFNISFDEKEIEKSVYILEFLEYRKELLSIYECQNYKIKSIFDSYRNEYNNLIKEIIDNFDDISKIKANISEIVHNYQWILELDHRKLFYIFKEKAPLAIFCLLMNDGVRKYYLPTEINDENGNTKLDISINSDKKEMFGLLSIMTQNLSATASLRDNILHFAGDTDSYWKDLETKGKKYMIISMGEGDNVRSAGKADELLSSADIRNKFVILDGIDYRSNSNYRTLYYMEV